MQEGGLREAVVDLANLVQVICAFIYCNSCGGCGAGGCGSAVVNLTSRVQKSCALMYCNGGGTMVNLGK